MNVLCVFMKVCDKAAGSAFSTVRYGTAGLSYVPAETLPDASIAHRSPPNEHTIHDPFPVES